MKDVDVAKIKKDLMKFCAKNPGAIRSEVINRLLDLVIEAGFAEMPVELLSFAMRIPLEVSII